MSDPTRDMLSGWWPWSKCATCEGAGSVWYEPYPDEFWRRRCHACAGRGGQYLVPAPVPQCRLAS